MKYQPKVPPDNDDDVQNWIWDELGVIADAFNEQDFVYLKQQNVAPVKPRTGMTALADGTNWNPGAGVGVYTYYGAAWHKLG